MGEALSRVFDVLLLSAVVEAHFVASATRDYSAGEVFFPMEAPDEPGPFVMEPETWGCQ